MDANTKKQERREKLISSLNVAIAALDVAEKALSITPAKAVFSVVKEILTMAKVRFPLLYVGESQAEVGIGCYDERRRLC